MAPRNDTPPVVAHWLTTDFIASFQRDVDPAIWTVVDGHHRGFFAIAVLTLVYCDAMAGLMMGTSSAGTEDTVKFIEREVAPNAGDPLLTTRYQDRAAALLHMYRHGPAHQREPGKLLWDGVEVSWSVIRGDDTAMHLKLTRGAPWYHLHVDVDLLNAHVLRTFKDIRDRALADAVLSRNIYLGAVEAGSPQTPRCGPNGYVGLKLSAMVTNPDP